MGGCCCCSRSDALRESDIEITTTTTNAAVTSKAGIHGEGVKTSIKSEDNKSSFLVSGETGGGGIALGSCTLDCDVGYWEVKIGENPEGVKAGIKRYNQKKPSSLDGTLSIIGGAEESPSWSFPPASQGGSDLKQGDVVSVFWDQTDLPMLSFAVNGVPVPSASVSRIRPSIDIIPAISVAQGSSAEFIFDGESFAYPPKGSKFKMIICSTSLI